MKQIPCAYCGRLVVKRDKEDVFPKCLYPSSKYKSKVQRLKVPACSECNQGWPKDEAHFRDILVMAGDKPNAMRQELWDTTIRRSFDKIDGPKRIQDLIAKMKPVTVNGSKRYMVFPGEDERVMRVVRKTIRGLCSYHKIMSPVSDKQVWVDILKYLVPQELLNQLTSYHREQDIVEYRYQIMNEQGINSAWHITFFQRVTFVGLVSMSEAGFGD